MKGCDYHSAPWRSLRAAVRSPGLTPSKRIPDPQIIYNILPPAALVIQLQLVHYPRILFPGLAEGNSDVEADHEEANVEAQSEPGVNGQLFQELTGELGAGLVRPGAVIHQPDIPRVEEEGAIERTAEAEPPFGVELELDVAGFIGKKVLGAGIAVSAGTH